VDEPTTAGSDIEDASAGDVPKDFLWSYQSVMPFWSKFNHGASILEILPYDTPSIR
jgi:hypothetical protein